MLVAQLTDGGRIEYNNLCGEPHATMAYASNREGRENTMSEVHVKENESLESALRRFKRQCARAGVIQEVRKREHYEKPSVKRKKKAEAARKRKY